MSIKASHITKKFKNFSALENVSIEVKEGEFMALLGPSGSGKTTLLRIIAGLENPDSGTVMFKEQNISKLPLQKRGVGFVFQHYALFKHMSVYENIAFGLKVKPKAFRFSPKIIREKVFALLKLVHLEGVQDKYPSQLSGGQKQRVALARVLAVEPQVMLLDEPFGSLDAKIRQELRRWLRRLHDEMKITTIFVTHDQEEALEIADRIAIMDKAEIVQIGTPEEIWNHPANAFVYDFLGNYNLLLGQENSSGDLILYDEIGSQVKEGNVSQSLGKNHKIFARPYQMEIVKQTEKPSNSIRAKIVHIHHAAPLVKIELERLNRQIIQVDLIKEKVCELGLKNGDDVWIKVIEYRMFD